MRDDRTQGGETDEDLFPPVGGWRERGRRREGRDWPQDTPFLFVTTERTGFLIPGSHG